MNFLSNFFENLAQTDIDKKLNRSSNLYIGWTGLTQEATNEKEVLHVLNNALKVVEGLKADHTNPATFYNQNVDKYQDVIAVYYCKASNRIKSANVINN
jgi:hypothetical protein